MSVLKILVADDDPQMQLALKAGLGRSGHTVTIVSDGQAALEVLPQQPFDLIITDQRMPKMTGLELLEHVSQEYPDLPVIMITAHGTINQAVDAMQRGAADFISKPFTNEELTRVVDRVVAPEVAEHRENRRAGHGAMGRPIVTQDPMMRRVLEVCESVARSDATVLVQGESGTGKELVARLIHDASPRVHQPFVAVNCAALPDTLLESELFGHEKGAFTGAQSRKIGKFELAHGGTILLDEISEMELGLQAKLLRVLQEREVDRVGGKTPISVDVRVVATTNRSLEQMVERGEFRADLFYRLNVIPVTLPALRQRVGDIQVLSEFFLKKFLGDKAPKLPSTVLSALQHYPWPGNVRELQNAVERAAILSQGRELAQHDFLLTQSAVLGFAPGGSTSIVQTEMPVEAIPLSASIERVETSQDEELTITPGMTVQEVERKLILETLKSTGDNRTQAAKTLGISIRTLRNKLNEYRDQGYFAG
ncbi:MAG: sigma-54-dependent Fis family transcriptional regulator [Bdellovibrionales bacterium]|nr:sigma-54-dependent Fis family transcriptional regulator [Bdellovibrionales bacterium]